MSSSETNKKNTVIAGCLLAFLVFTKVLLEPFGGLDELWLYNYSRCIVMGYTLYTDFKFAIMPLFPVLFAIPLYIVRNLFVYRLTCALMMFALSFTYYRIASKMTDHMWGLFTSLLFILFMDFATYNGLMVLFALFVFILFRNVTVRSAVAIGALSGLAILCRQTSGVFLFIAVIIILFADKSLRKYILPCLAGWGVVMVVFAACLLATGSFNDFWDLCFFVFFNSEEKNSGFQTDGIVPCILAAAGIISSIVLIRKNKDKTDIIHLVIGVILLTIAVPIIDMMHMYYATVWFLIPLFKLMKKSVSASLLKIILAAMSVVIFILNVYELPETTLDNRYEEFVLIPIKSSEIDYYEPIIEINSRYEAEGRRVILLTSGRCITGMMTNSADPAYDLFLKGHSGTRTPIGVIEDELANDNVVFAIPDDYEEENWENPTGVLELIQSECTPIERYDVFVWYVPSSAEA